MQTEDKRETVVSTLFLIGTLETTKEAGLGLADFAIVLQVAQELLAQIKHRIIPRPMTTAGRDARE